MAIQERREQILDLVRHRGFVSIEALSRQFSVTPQTIRRDINGLCKQNLVARYHGGAGLPSSVENLDYTARKIMNLSAKQKIAQLVARHIPDNASLFINIGTTTEAVAKALLGHKNLRIITNNLHVATILAAHPDFEVILAGGVVRNRDGGIIGEATIDLVNQFRVDYGIIGISGIDDDGTLLDFDYREVRVAQAIVSNSRCVFLAADHSKFGRNALVCLGNISQISALFTERQPPPRIRQILNRNDIELRIANDKALGNAKTDA